MAEEPKENEEVKHVNSDDEERNKKVAEVLYVQSYGTRNLDDIEKEIDENYKKMMNQIDELMGPLRGTNMDPALVNSLIDDAKNNARKDFYNVLLRNSDISEIEKISTENAYSGVREALMAVDKSDFEPEEEQSITDIAHEIAMQFDSKDEDKTNDKISINIFSDNRFDIMDEEDAQNEDIIDEMFNELEKNYSVDKVRDTLEKKLGIDANLRFFERKSVDELLEDDELTQGFELLLEKMITIDKNDERFDDDEWTKANKANIITNLFQYDGNNPKVAQWMKQLEKADPELYSIMEKHKDLIKNGEITWEDLMSNEETTDKKEKYSGEEFLKRAEELLEEKEKLSLIGSTEFDISTEDNKQLMNSFLENMGKNSEYFRETSSSLIQKCAIIKKVMEYEGPEQQEWLKILQGKEPELYQLVSGNREFFGDSETVNEFIKNHTNWKADLKEGNKEMKKNLSKSITNYKPKDKKPEKKESEDQEKIDEDKEKNEQDRQEQEKTDEEKESEDQEKIDQEKSSKPEISDEQKKKNIENGIKKIAKTKGIEFTIEKFIIPNGKKDSLFYDAALNVLEEQKDSIDFKKPEIAEKTQELFMGIIEKGDATPEIYEKMTAIDLDASKEVLKQILEKQKTYDRTIDGLGRAIKERSQVLKPDKIPDGVRPPLFEKKKNSNDRSNNDSGPTDRDIDDGDER